MFRVLHSIVLLSLSCVPSIYALSGNNNFYMKNGLNHLLNFTTDANGRFATIEPKYLYLTAAQSDASLTVPTVFTIPDVTNPVFSIPARTDAEPDVLVWRPNAAYKATFGSTAAPKFGFCIAGEGLLNTYNADKFVFWVNSCSGAGTGCVPDKVSFSSFIQADGKINGTAVWLTAPTTCNPSAAGCTLDMVIKFTPLATTDGNTARLYITTPDIQLAGSDTYTTAECPTNLLARIKAFQAGTPIIDTSSTGATTNTTSNATSTSTGESATPSNTSTNSNSSSSSNSTSTGGGSSIFSNSSSSPTFTPTATPTPPAPITTLNFDGNTILTISNAMKFKGGSNGALVSVWFKLLSSSLPPQNTPLTVFRVFATKDAATITQLGLVLIRPRASTTSYTVRLIAGNYIYEWGFVDLRIDEWEHIMAVRNDDYAYLVINNRGIESQKGVTGETFGSTPTTAVIGGSGINGQTITEPFIGLLHRIVITTDGHDLKVAMPTAAQVAAVASSLYNNGIPANITVYNQVDDPKLMYVFANETGFVKNANGQVRFIDQLNSQDTTTEAVANSATINFVQQSPGVAVPTTSSPTTASPTTPSPTISGSSSSSNSSTGGVGGSSSPNNTTQSSSGAGSSSSSTAGATPPNAAYQNTISVTAIVITGITCIGRLF